MYAHENTQMFSVNVYLLSVLHVLCRHVCACVHVYMHVFFVFIYVVLNECVIA